MKFFIAQVLLNVSALAVAVQTLVASDSVHGTVPNHFIVEMEQVSTFAKRTQSLDSVYSSLHRRAVPFAITREYNVPGIFIGAAVVIKNPKDVALILNTPGVKGIRPIVRYQIPKPVIAKAIFGPYDPAVPPNSQSTHLMTGVDKLHSEGITGSGIKIGIIDTGIDYTHPALGAGFGPGFKVVGGYDFVGPAYNGTNEPTPGPDPLDKCNGHGTHVAGIVGANPNNPFNISGVAYQSSLYAYRVFGCSGMVTDDILVAALLQGVDDGNDILTLSIGGPSGWTESTVAVVASRIAASGKIVTIAAGNDGDTGAWYASAPGTGKDVISVASVENTIVPLQSVLVSGVSHDPITYFSFQPLPTTGSFLIFVTSNDTRNPADACNPLPNNTPDLSQYVTIVRRGTCDFVQKLQNVAAKGGKLVLIYDNGRGFAAILTGNFTNAALIQAADGEYLVNQYATGANVTLTFPKEGRHVEYTNPYGGLISSFSSYGPTFDFFFKPAIGAPGGDILSTMPTSLDSYAVLSGTSMATPYVAGAAALLLCTKGKSRSVTSHARTLFQTTARVVPSSHTDGDPLQTVTQQGAGLINVYDAIRSTTRVSPGELILNDTSHFRSVRSIKVKNNCDDTKSYNVKHIPAGTALTVRPATIFTSTGPVPLSNVSLSVVLSPENFSLLPGKTQIVTATFSLPTDNIDKSTFPVFSGFIEVEGDSVHDSYHVSYIGLGASLKTKQILDNTDELVGVKLPLLLDETGNVQTAARSYTFVNGDAPTIYGRLVFGTPRVCIDLVDENLKFYPSISSRDSLVPTITFPDYHKGGSFAQVETIGSLGEFRYLPRNSEVASSNNTYERLTLMPNFANGTTIPNGNYRVLIRVLRVSGNPTREEDYESWLSPVVGVQVGSSATKV